MAEQEFFEGEIARSTASYRIAILGLRGVDRSVSKATEAGYAHMLYLSGNYAESVEHGLTGLSLARESTDMGALTYVLGPLGLALAASGRYQEADAAFAEARQVGTQYNIPRYRARAISMSTTPALDLFDFDGELRSAQEASELGHRFDVLPAKGSAALDTLSICLRSGELGRAIDLLPAARDLVIDYLRTHGIALHGWIWSLRLAQFEAEIAVARRTWREAVRLATSSVEASRARMRPKYESAALVTRAQALVALGRKREALADMTAAVELARSTADPALFVRIAAAMLRVEPNAPLAAEAYESVARILKAVPNAQMGRCFEASETVQFIYRARGPDSKGRAQQPGYPDGLSEREVDVLKLVAAGKSNTQIADELVISVNTVQHHVTNILSKTGLANRTQAAAYAHGVGIV
jgi:DNA-binding CsgD family transcriptional regulator